MKKAYIAPATGVYNIDAANIIATSMEINNEIEVNTMSEQLGREDNAISNIWDSEW